MKNALKEAFNVIIEKRVEGEAFAMARQTAEYCETEKQIDGSFEDLRASLDNENQINLLLELEEGWNRQKALQLEYAYRQGLEDSVVLQDVLKKYEQIGK